MAQATNTEHVELPTETLIEVGTASGAAMGWGEVLPVAALLVLVVVLFKS